MYNSPYPKDKIKILLLEASESAVETFQKAGYPPLHQSEEPNRPF